MKRKILFLIWALEVGGAERLLVALAKKIPKDKYDITIGCITRKGLWATELEACGIKVVSLNKKVGFDPTLLPKICRLIKNEDPDLINTHLWTADLWGRLGAFITNKSPVIVTEQNVDVWKKWYHRILDWLLFLKTDYVICVSNEVARFYKEAFHIPSRKIRMIPNAIDLARFDIGRQEGSLRNKLRLDKSKFIFVCAARLHPQKAHEVLIRSAAMLQAQGEKNFEILIVGEGERRGSLEQMVAKLGLSNYIKFLGLREDIPEIFLASNAFILSSDYEGLPLTILEAMAARLPIIATDVGGNSQVVIDGKTGFLVPPRKPEALASAMFKIMKDREAAMQMGRKGRGVVESEYSIDAITYKTLELFNLAMTKRK